jgi:Uma2 family endonuclease
MDKTSLPPLQNGERLDQKTFHVRYEAMPKRVRAELIGGIVYLLAPDNLRHGRVKMRVVHWLTEYEDATPGTEAYANSTAILGEDSETQPDAHLIIPPEKGGQMRMNEDEYLEGAPELVAEVALNREAIDLHAKKKDYEKAGVREYVVIVLQQNQIIWYISPKGRFEELALEVDGIFRSGVFPGLWLDPDALLRLDKDRIREVLQQGLASPKHAAFVGRLAAQ